MPIWKLSPIDLTDPSWEASTHKGAAIVRAPDEHTARAAASIAFALATLVVHGRRTIIPPWRYAGLVSAERVAGIRWPEEGKIEILDPPDANGDVKGVDWTKT